MSDFTFTLVGVDELQDNLEALKSQMDHAIDCALYEEAQILRTDAMRHCPVDTGTLRGAHYATLPEKQGDARAVEVGTGGPAKHYAKWVHERTSLKHKVGEAKWLENAFKRRASGFAERFGDLVKHHFDRRSGPPGQAAGVPTSPDARQ
jgi:hypothetical protein